MGHREARTWAADVLRDQRMPRGEIRSVLDADDPELIRRRLELHAERLQERLVDQLRTLSDLERWLVEAIDRQAGPPEGDPVRRSLSPAGTS